jgi:hypothetical protein
MREADIFTYFGVTKSSLLESLRANTETALSRAQFLRTSKIEVLQALVIYIVSIVFCPF